MNKEDISKIIMVKPHNPSCFNQTLLNICIDMLKSMNIIKSVSWISFKYGLKIDVEVYIDRDYSMPLFSIYLKDARMNQVSFFCLIYDQNQIPGRILNSKETTSYSEAKKLCLKSYKNMIQYLARQKKVINE